MNLAISITKLVIKWTPRSLISWVANIVLKDIAELTRLEFDFELRTADIEVQLAGEPEVITIKVDGFSIISDENSYRFFIDQAHSNRLWLDNILARITGKGWKIPDVPKFQPQIKFIAQLLAKESILIEKK